MDNYMGTHLDLILTPLIFTLKCTYLLHGAGSFLRS